MFQFKNITELVALLSVLIVGSTKITNNLVNAGVSGTSALSTLAEDAEDAALKSTELNKLDRAHRYNLRLAEIRQLEAGIVDPTILKKAA